MGARRPPSSSVPTAGWANTTAVITKVSGSTVSQVCLRLGFSVVVGGVVVVVWFGWLVWGQGVTVVDVCFVVVVVVVVVVLLLLFWGAETSLFLYRYSGLGQHFCGHHQGVGVDCQPSVLGRGGGAGGGGRH